MQPLDALFNAIRQFHHLIRIHLKNVKLKRIYNLIGLILGFL